MDIAVTYQKLLGTDRPHHQNPDNDSNLSTNERMEAEVRRALAKMGKTPAPAAHQPSRTSHRPRHRFVRDGEEPVVVMKPQHERRGRSADPATLSDRSPENRLEAVETLLREERAARAQVEQALHAAQVTISDLQTKLGHAVLARDEALEAVRAAEARMQDADACRTEERQQPISAAAAVTSDTPRRRGRPPGSSRGTMKAEPARAGAEIEHKEVSTSSETPSALPSPGKQAARPRKPRQKPVKWWVEGWQSEFGF